MNARATFERGTTSIQAPIAGAIYVPAGKDRFQQELRIWGQFPLCNKLSGRDTDGSMYIFMHPKMAKGGPPRHIHHAQDEWFFIIEGEFAIEVGDEKFRAKPGDSLLAPREIPHVWACVSDTPGVMLTIVSPVGTFEEFLLETTRLPTIPTPEELTKAFEAGGMTVVGPPLPV